MNINQQVIELLQDKGVNTIRFTREDVGVEYVLESPSQLFDLFNQLDVAGRDIVFSPLNTIEYMGTLAQTTYPLLDGMSITKFKIIN